ncbi:MAG: hypothetical protein GX129_12400, partial [Clostridiales bacterium]|nr:hypothetical protein [Clostridiales bacterium]
MGYNPEEVSIEALRGRITILQTDSRNAVQNSFNINIASDNPEDARKLAEVLYRNYIEFIDVMVAEGASTYFSNYYNVQINTLQDSLDSDKQLLEKSLELLDNTPKTINQREVMDEIISSDNTRDFIVMGNIINPNYTELELGIIEIKQAINSTENTINQYNQYLKELELKQAEIASYYETGEFAKLTDNIVRITKSNIYLPSEPVAPSSKTSPSNSRNVLIGVLLGGVVA